MFLDIGGVPKKKTQKYPDNNFPTVFVLCPGAQASSLWRLSQAGNSYDLARYIAYLSLYDRRKRGASPSKLLSPEGILQPDPSGMEDQMLTPVATQIASALRPYGYAPEAFALSATL